MVNLTSAFKKRIQSSAYNISYNGTIQFFKNNDVNKYADKNISFNQNDKECFDILENYRVQIKIYFEKYIFLKKLIILTFDQISQVEMLIQWGQFTTNSCYGCMYTFIIYIVYTFYIFIL